MTTSHQIFERLTHVTRLTCTSKSAVQHTDFMGTGEGSVESGIVDKNTILFKEAGAWQKHNSSQKYKFHNDLLWQFNHITQIISLNRMRADSDIPTHLDDLSSVQSNIWTSCGSHICGNDTYHAKITILKKQIKLIWTVKGKTKNYTLTFCYS